MKNVSKVFYITLVLVIIAVVFGGLFPVQFENITTNIQEFVATKFGWYYMLLMSATVILSIFIAISPYGKIRLGKDNSKPDFSTPTWIAMLFSAGMGIGLVFYGAAEALSDYLTDDTYSEVGFNAALTAVFAQCY